MLPLLSTSSHDAARQTAVGPRLSRCDQGGSALRGRTLLLQHRAAGVAPSLSVGTTTSGLVDVVRLPPLSVDSAVFVRDAETSLGSSVVRDGRTSGSSAPSKAWWSRRQRWSSANPAVGGTLDLRKHRIAVPRQTDGVGRSRAPSAPRLRSAEDAQSRSGPPTGGCWR